MGDSDLTIRAGVVADVVPLATLLRRVFATTYAAAISAAEMAAYLGQSFSLERVAEELDEGGYFVAEADGVLIGISRLTPGGPPGYELGGAVELVRLYVDEPFHGRGVGGALLAHTLAAARARGHTTLWLSVWEQNERALAFYRKHGFVTFGQAPYMVGALRFDDLLMRRSLDDR